MSTWFRPGELAAVIASPLPRDVPYAYTGVSQTQLSIARHYGAATVGGYRYTYLPETDELIRDDVLRFIERARKDAAAGLRRAERERAEMAQGGLFA